MLDPESMNEWMNQKYKINNPKSETKSKYQKSNDNILFSLLE